MTARSPRRFQPASSFENSGSSRNEANDGRLVDGSQKNASKSISVRKSKSFAPPGRSCAIVILSRLDMVALAEYARRFELRILHSFAGIHDPPTTLWPPPLPVDLPVWFPMNNKLIDAAIIA